MKRILSLLLTAALALSLAACGAPAPEAPAPKPGRWVEEEINVPIPENAGRWEFFGHDDDDTIDVVFYNDMSAVIGWSHSADLGKSWQSMDVSFLDEPMAAFEDPCCQLKIGEGGKVWLFLREKTQEEKLSGNLNALYSMGYERNSEEPPFLPEQAFYYYLEDGKAFPVPTPFSSSDFNSLYMLPEFYPLADGSCMFKTYDAALVTVGRDGTISNRFDTRNYSNGRTIWQVYGDQCLIGSNTAELADLAAEASSSLPLALPGAWGLSAKGAVYGISPDKLMRVAPGSTLAEELISGNDYFFSGQCNAFNGLFSIGEEIFAVINNRLFRYYYDAQAILSPGETITVFSMHDDFAVRQTIAQLRLTDPSLNVIYRIGDEELSDGLTKNDFIKSLHTELLAGAGPDVMILDDMAPLDSYLQSGVFTDLSTMIDTSKLYPNILKAGSYQDHLYAVPAGIAFPAYTSYVSNIEGLLDGVPPEELPTVAFEGSLPDYDTLAPIFTQSQSQAQRKVRQKLGENGGNKQIYLVHPYLYTSVEALCTAVLPDVTGTNVSPETVKALLELLHWMDPIIPDSVPDHYSLLRLRILTGDKSDIVPPQIKPLPSLSGKKVFLPYTIAAIPQKKTPSEGAAAFLNALVSPAVQSRLFYGTSFITYEWGASLFTRISSPKSYIPVIKSFFTDPQYTQAIQQLDTPAYLNAERAQAFFDIACRYIKDELTLDEAADEVLSAYSREDALAALEMEK